MTDERLDQLDLDRLRDLSHRVKVAQDSIGWANPETDSGRMDIVRAQVDLARVLQGVIGHLQRLAGPVVLVEQPHDGEDRTADWTPVQIRRRREIANLTHQQLADSLGVSRRTVVGWEGGERSPSGRHKAQLDRILRSARNDTGHAELPVPVGREQLAELLDDARECVRLGVAMSLTPVSLSAVLGELDRLRAQAAEPPAFTFDGMSDFDRDDPAAQVWIRCTAEWPGGDVTDHLVVSRAWWEALTEKQRDDWLLDAAAELASNSSCGYGASVVDVDDVPEGERREALS